MKKFISAILSLILVLSLVLSFAGCDKNGGKDSGKDSATTNASGEEAATNAGRYIDVELDSIAFRENLDLMDAYLANEEYHFATLTEGYGMSEEVAQKFYETPEEFYVYSYSVDIFNSGSEKISVYGFRCENNAKDGVYINVNNALGGVANLDPGTSCGATIDVICSDPDLSQDETRQIVDSMGIEVICSKIPLEYDDGTESVEETKYIEAEIE